MISLWSIVFIIYLTVCVPNNCSGSLLGFMRFSLAFDVLWCMGKEAETLLSNRWLHCFTWTEPLVYHFVGISWINNAKWVDFLPSHREINFEWNVYFYYPHKLWQHLQCLSWFTRCPLRPHHQTGSMNHAAKWFSQFVHHSFICILLCSIDTD